MCLLLFCWFSAAILVLPLLEHLLLHLHSWLILNEQPQFASLCMIHGCDKA